MRFIFVTMLLIICSFLTLRGTFAQSTTNQFSEGDRIEFMQKEEAPAAEPSNSLLILKSVGALLLICGLIFGVAWGLKKFGLIVTNDTKHAEPVELAVVGNLNLGAGRTVTAIRFDGKTLLVGATSQNFTLLSEQVDQVKQGRSVRELLEDSEYDFANVLTDAERRVLERGGDA